MAVKLMSLSPEFCRSVKLFFMSGVRMEKLDRSMVFIPDRSSDSVDVY